MSAQKLEGVIKNKKFRILFHPDNVEYLDSSEKEIFMKMVSVVSDMMNDFDEIVSFAIQRFLF